MTELTIHMKQEEYGSYVVANAAPRMLSSVQAMVNYAQIPFSDDWFTDLILKINGISTNFQRVSVFSIQILRVCVRK